MVRLPCERLLDKVDAGAILAKSHSATDLVAQGTGAAHGDNHGTDLMLLLHRQESLNVGTAGEHLNSGRGAVNLLGGSRLADEEHDSQHVSPLVHGENLSHPGSDPFQVLGTLDCPHKENLAGCDSAICEPIHEPLDIRHLMGDANTSSKEHHGTVRIQGVGATVGTLGIASRLQSSTRCSGCLLVQVVCESSSGSDDVGHTLLLGGHEILSGACQSVRRGILHTINPGDGEGVRLPEADAGHVQIGVLSGTGAPRASQGGR